MLEIKIFHHLSNMKTYDLQSPLAEVFSLYYINIKYLQNKWKAFFAFERFNKH